MTAGDGLLGEVRRNLAAYAGQPQLSFPRDAIQALYVAGNGENAVLQEKLQATLGIPVHGIDPFVNEERIDVAANSRAGFTGAAGLLSLWAEHQAMPANFVKPREAKPVASPAKKRVLVYGVLAAVVLGGGLFGAFSVLANTSAQERDLREQKAAADKRLKDLQPEAKYLEALKEWVDGDISDLDEMYDLVARAPWVQGFRISKMEKTVVLQPKSAAATAKDKFLVHVTIKGRIFRKDQRLLQNWVDAINRDPHCKAKSDKISTIINAADPDMSVQEFEVIIDIARQPATAYTTTFSPPSKR
jgi:hypothetical protein